MPSKCVIALLLMVCTFAGAEETTVTEAAPTAEAPAATTPKEPGALPDIELPAKSEQGDPVPPQTLGEAPATEAPAPPVATDSDEASMPSSEAVKRPTETQQQTNRKVGAFWFITTGK